ncbi:putative dolichyl-diphosphooligosaccharide--protein glycosyltransferase subunit 3b [Quercus suber]|uniref:Dolichyl-diphosphooligosaccharide--protein glycosyltransferase subunit 3b n=1 Tax=Quercus suber TaxID=58331 RepID=A0AAW0LZQ8_QUESU
MTELRASMRSMFEEWSQGIAMPDGNDGNETVNLESFALFGVNGLPHIRLAAPHQSPKQSEQMDQGDFSRLAESMADFVQAKTKLNVGLIHRPPFLSTRQLGFNVVATLVWIPFAIKKIVKGKTLLHDPKLWLTGLVFDYFFSFLFGFGFRERDGGRWV